MTSINNTNHGIQISNCDSNRLGQLTVANNGVYGFYISGTSTSTEVQNNILLGTNGGSAADDCVVITGGIIAS